MSPPADPALPRHVPAIDPHVVGAVCGIVAALGYTASNVFLRSVVHCDPIFVSCVKTVPTVLLIGPLLITRIVAGQTIVSSYRALYMLAATAILGQVGGNVVFQWSLGVVGMALTVALCFGTMISSGALLGWLCLGEHVTPRMFVSSAILVVAIFVLSFGAGAAQQSVGHVVDRATESGWLLLAAGIAAPCFSGLAYSVLNVTIRNYTRAGTPLVTVLSLVGMVGLFSLGSLSWLRIGTAGMWATSPHDFWMMVGAGVCNAAAFWALAKALHLTSVVIANGLNASQTAFAALAGVLLFGEAVTWALVIGVVLTMLGLMMIKGRPHTVAPAAVVPADNTPEDEIVTIDGEPITPATIVRLEGGE